MPIAGSKHRTGDFDVVHVIEYSAYDKLRADAEALVIALENLAEGLAPDGDHGDGCVSAYAHKALKKWRGEGE